MTWALVLILQFGTPYAREITVTHYRTWEMCILRAVHEVRTRKGVTGVRCERSAGEPA